MKRILYPILRSLVNYYNHGSTKEIAYEKAIMVFMLLIWMNLYSAFTFFDLSIGILKSDDSKIEQYIKVILISSPIYLLIRKLYPREAMLNEHSHEIIKVMNLKTILYMSVTFLVMTIAVLSKV